MKKLLTIALIIAAASTANAQVHNAKAVSGHKHQSKGVAKATASSVLKDLSQFAGTNDSNLALVREGIKKA